LWLVLETEGYGKNSDTEAHAGAIIIAAEKLFLKLT
jgi:hypothetical protein